MAERHNTQLCIIREHLLSGHTITPIEALNMCGCFRLSAIIYILRHDEGLPIMMSQPEATNGKPYAKYWIDSAYLAAHPHTPIPDEP